MSGPEEPPVMQVQVASHQPQAASPVQVSQLQWSLHASGAGQAEA